MKRSSFLKQVGAMATTTIVTPAKFSGLITDQHPELAKHKIKTVDIVTAAYRWPRFVGRNGAKDLHGQDHTTTILRVRTDQGAEGWGMTDKKVSESLSGLIGKRVIDVITPEAGLASGFNTFHYDFAMFDLMGVIMKKPVYEILGSKGSLTSPVYSGMIYIDELPYKEIKGGLEVIMQNCAADYKYGYRQLKIKIGRGYQWYSPKEGMEMLTLPLVLEIFPPSKVLHASRMILTMETTLSGMVR